MVANAAPPFYTDLRRRLGVVATVVALAGMFQLLRVSAREVSTIVLQVPPTTHLFPGRTTIALPHSTDPPTVGSAGATGTTGNLLPPVTVPSRILNAPSMARPAAAPISAAAATSAPAVAPAAPNAPAPASEPASGAASAGGAGNAAAPAPASAPAAAPASAPDPPAGAPDPPAGAPDPPPRAAPPTGGAYRYRYTVGSGYTDGTVTVGAIATNPSGVTQETETERVGTTARSRTLDWSSGAATITVSNYGTGPCQWSPGLTSWQLPLRVGERWATHASCPFANAGGNSGSLGEDESVKVDGFVSTTVGGERVQAWVIERTTTITEAVSGVAVTTETQSTELFAPAYGLVVFEDGRTATPNADGTFSTTDSAFELLSLHPG